MARYIVMLDKDCTSIGAVVPDCPGCTAIGASEEEATHNVTEALREWLADRQAAGLPAPEPRSLAALQGEGELTAVQRGRARVVVVTVPGQQGWWEDARYYLRAGPQTAVSASRGRCSGASRDACPAA